MALILLCFTIIGNLIINDKQNQNKKTKLIVYVCQKQYMAARKFLDFINFNMKINFLKKETKKVFLVAVNK